MEPGWPGLQTLSAGLFLESVRMNVCVCVSIEPNVLIVCVQLYEGFAQINTSAA